MRTVIKAERERESFKERQRENIKGAAMIAAAAAATIFGRSPCR